MSTLGKLLLIAVPIGLAVASSRNGGGASSSTPPPPSTNGRKPGPTTPATPTPPTKPGEVPGWPPLPPEPPPAGSWLASLAEEYSVARERQVFDAVANGQADAIEWWNISTPGAGKYDGYRMHVPVMADALKVEGVRVNASYPTTQAIADHLGLVMLTPYIAGAIYARAHAQLSPTTSQDLTNKEVTATTSQMIDASRVVDQKLAPIKAARDERGETTLVGNPGKDWATTIWYTREGVHPKTGVPHKWAGANIGFWEQPWRPIQTLGLAHNLGHVDYSQIVRLMGPVVLLEAPDGTVESRQTADVMQDAELAHFLTGVKNKAYGLIAGEGALPYARHPKLPQGTYV